MSINIGRTRIFLFSMVIILSPFQDTVFGKMPTGVLTSNLAFLPCLVLVLLSLDVLKKVIINVKVFYYLISFYIINFLAIAYYLFFYDFKFEIMIYKMFSMSILYFMYFFLAFITYDFLQNGYLCSRLKRLIFISLTIIILGAILNVIFPSSFCSDLFHTSAQNDISRPRGFALEPSMLGYDSLAVYLLFVTLSKGRSLLWNLPIILISFIVRSKGGLLIIGISYLILQVVEMCSSRFLVVKNFIKIFFGLILLSVIFFGIFFTLSNDILNDIQKFSSVATRSVVLMVGVRSLMFPWGQGFSGFYPFFLNSVISIVEYLQGIVPLNLKFTEIFLMVDNMENIGTKTLLWDGTIIFGIPFFYLYVKYGILICRRFIWDKNIYGLLLSMVTFLSGATYTSFIGYSYLSAICFGYLFYEYKKEDISCST